MNVPLKPGGVGASLPRLEDDRHLRGRGRFVGDIKLPGMLDVAFVRSPLAHARVHGIAKPAGFEASVFVHADLKGVSGIRADSGLAGFRSSIEPVLSYEKVRYVGEPLAACVADGRAAAEDIAELVSLNLEALPAVHDMTKARDADAPLLHETWSENVFLEAFVDTKFDVSAPSADVKISHTMRTSRQSMCPIEGRGIVAYWDNHVEQIVLYSSTQMPHIVRTGLAECLGLPEGKVRVVAPDVGGGFGYKGILLREEVCLAYLAMHLRRPMRWIEDRREHLTGNANCREHHYEISGYAKADGTLVAVDCEAIVDSGAYSIYPFSACLESAQVPSILPGPYQFEGFRCRTWSVATNKPPIVPYRGVARTGVCFAIEVLMDSLARKIGMDPVEFRLRNLVRPEQMPFTNITKKLFDSGDYPEALKRAAAAINNDSIRARQKAGEPDGRRLGLGYSIYCEQGAHGTSVYAGWGIPMVPGFEQASMRLTPDGGVEIRVGVHSHGQGLETTLAQVARELLGVSPSTVKVIHGDTALTPYSTGSWGSRCMVMAGGAVASACDILAGRIKTLAGHLLQADASTILLADGLASSASGSISIADIARTWYRRPQDLPAGFDPAGLEVTQGYKTLRDSGTFSYAAHAVVLAVDTTTGTIEILDYVIVEDGGVLINPMIVDGQVYGGTAQGLGSAMYEEMRYDAAGQPLASTLADYHLPGACEVPSIRLLHMETPSPISYFGQKGIGEGGAIAPPAAIANAVNDALAEFGVEMLELPITPDRIRAKLAAAQRHTAQVTAP